MAFEDTFRSIRVDKMLEIGANVSFPYQAFTATGTMVPGVATGLVAFAHATVPILLTIPAPIGPGQLLILKDTSATGTAAHVMTAASGTTFNGTNTIATFDAPDEMLILMSISSTAWTVLVNSGSVSLSGP